MNLLLRLVGGWMLVLIAAGLQAATPPVLHPLGKSLLSDQQGPFVTIRDGSVLCVDAQHARISRDEGRTWSQHALFKDPAKHQVSSERALLRTKGGVVIAAYMNMKEKAHPPGFKWGGSAEEFKQWVLPIYVTRSLDDGLTWEEPMKLSTPWCGCVHSMIETKSGRIVMVGQTVIPEWRHATVMFVSDDQGRTWQRSNLLDIGKGRHDHAGSCEATVVERADGSLYQLLRTEEGWQYEAVSHDGGLKWEDFMQSPVRSVTCCAQMSRLSDGRVALLWNHPPRHSPSSGSSREELSLAFSEDDAKTWSKPVVVAGAYGKGARVSYPYLYERSPGEFWITTMQGGLRMKIQAADLAKEELPVYQPPPPTLPKPGCIIMFGDSTTAERGSVSKVYSQRIQDGLESVGSSLVVYNAGVGGNTTRDAKKRFERDVLAHQPRLVVMQFGINDSAVDVWKKPPATSPRVPLAEYLQNLREMISQAHQRNVRVILMTPNPIRWTDKLKDMYGRSPYEAADPLGFEKATLLSYKEALRQLSAELRVPLVDVHSAYASSGKSAEGLLLDGMHPNDKGHALVAERLLPVLRSELTAKVKQ